MGAVFTGTWSDDTIIGGDGHDTLEGFDGNDLLAGEYGNDDLYGDDGDDTLDGGPGADWLDGGAGYDLVDYYYAPYAVTVDLLLGVASGGDGNDTLTGIEDVAGSAYDDALYGDDGHNRLYGDDGDDLLSGGGGDDTLEGGFGNDRLVGGAGFDMADYYYSPDAVTVDLWLGRASGGAGNDTLSGVEDVAGSAWDDALYGNAADNLLYGDNGDDVLSGGDGADTLEGGAGDDLLAGGAGYDMADYFYADAAVTVDLVYGEALGGAGHDTLSGIEDVNGGYYADRILGNAAHNALWGREGNDTLRGGAGADTLEGGSGADSLAGGGGNDVYRVGAGDAVRELAAAGVDLVRSGVTWTLGAYLENLLLTGSNATSGFGNALGNVLTGNAAGNVLSGLAGADTLNGGAGADWLSGGLGADRFVFSVPPGGKPDAITDFAPGIDRIALDDDAFTAFDAGLSPALGVTQFVAGKGITAAQDASDRIACDTATGILYYDADGAGGMAAIAFGAIGSGAAATLEHTDFMIVS